LGTRLSRQAQTFDLDMNTEEVLSTLSSFFTNSHYQNNKDTKEAYYQGLVTAIAKFFLMLL
jgi:hypothetical protein